MKILVPTKRVPDTDYKIRVRDDGKGIDEAQVPFVLNPFDAIALEEALRIAEQSSETVEVVTAGIGDDRYEQELRTGLAMGAERAILVQCQAALDPWNVARLLQAVVAREQPDLVLMGKQAVDDDANQTGQMLAALLDWPQATFASRIEFVSGGLRVSRETDRGIEVVTVMLPAVVTADLRLAEPRYVSLPSIMKAKKKSVERISTDQLGVGIEPRVRIVAVRSVTTKRACTIVPGAAALIAKLREEAKVL